MLLSRRMSIWSFVLGALTFVPTFARAQEERRGGGQERFQQMLREQLGASEEEWKVLSPKIEKVQTIQRSSRSFGGFGFGGRGGPGGGGRDRDRDASSENQSPVQTASRALREALQNKDTPAEEIGKRLTALREAKAKARAELETAQKELKEVLTQRQEAVLVQFGMLD